MTVVSWQFIKFDNTCSLYTLLSKVSPKFRFSEPTFSEIEFEERVPPPFQAKAKLGLMLQLYYNTCHSAYYALQTRRSDARIYGVRHTHAGPGIPQAHAMHAMPTRSVARDGGGGGGGGSGLCPESISFPQTFTGE